MERLLVCFPGECVSVRGAARFHADGDVDGCKLAGVG